MVASADCRRRIRQRVGSLEPGMVFVCGPAPIEFILRTCGGAVVCDGQVRVVHAAISAGLPCVVVPRGSLGHSDEAMWGRTIARLKVSGAWGYRPLTGAIGLGTGPGTGCRAKCVGSGCGLPAFVPQSQLPLTQHAPSRPPSLPLHTHTLLPPPHPHPPAQLGAFVPSTTPSQSALRSALSSVMTQQHMARRVQAVGARVRAEAGNDAAVTAVTSCLCVQVLPASAQQALTDHPRSVAPLWLAGETAGAEYVCVKHCVVCGLRP
jgi:hypothetical protein